METRKEAAVANSVESNNEFNENWESEGQAVRREVIYHLGEQFQVNEL